MITASVVTYNHHLLEIEPVLRSLFASPVDLIYIVDHSDEMLDLKMEVQAFAQKVLMGEPHLREKVSQGFKMLYYPHHNIGYGGGHNFAMRMAIEEGSEFHLVVNPDVWFGPDVISEMLAYMGEHPDVGQMMPRVFFPNGAGQPLVKLLPDPIDLFGRFCLPAFLIKRRNARFELQHSNYAFPINAPFLSGCFMLFRVSALLDVGLFDERYFMYAEDIDITRRMHRRYKTIFYPKTSIYHKYNRQSYRSFKLMLVHIVNVMRYFNHYGWWNDKERRLFNQQCLKEIDEANAHLI